MCCVGVYRGEPVQDRVRAVNVARAGWLADCAFSEHAGDLALQHGGRHTASHGSNTAGPQFRAVLACPGSGLVCEWTFDPGSCRAARHSIDLPVVLRCSQQAGGAARRPGKVRDMTHWTSRRRALPLAVVLITSTTLGGVAYAASGQSDRTSSGRTAGSAQRGATFCEPVKDFGIPWTTSLRGDVDGDGIADTVASHAKWRAGGGCRAWLVVNTAKGRFQSPIDALGSTLLKPPGLAGLIQLRPGRRLDVAVVVWLGASTGFLDVYGLASHRLVRLSSNTYE